METLFNVGFGHYPDIIWRGPELGMIYQDYKTPTYSTGVITAEASWFVRKWFTFSLTGGASLTWQGYRDSVTDKRTGTDVGVNLYIVPQARFNWVRGERVRMYSTIGLGGVIGITGDEFLALGVPMHGEDATTLMSSLRQSITDLNHGEPWLCDISVSMGVYLDVPKADARMEELILLADNSMYAEKHSHHRRIGQRPKPDAYLD